MTRRPRAALRRRWGRRIVPGVTVLGILALVFAFPCPQIPSAEVMEMRAVTW